MSICRRWKHCGSALERVPTSLSARFDRACAVVVARGGHRGPARRHRRRMWDMRNRGVIPPGALPRVRAFADWPRTPRLTGGAGKGTTVIENEFEALEPCT